jgi:thiamine transporter ThiT
MIIGKLLRWVGVALAGLALVFFSPAAFSQSCALCYTQAASSGSLMIEALRSGILVLIIPPTLMWLVIAAIMYSKRNQFKRADDAAGSNANW